MRRMEEWNFKKLNNLDRVDEIMQLGYIAYAQYQSVLDKYDWGTLKDALLDKNGILEVMKKSTVFVCEKKYEFIGAVFLVSSGHPTEYFSADWSYVRMLSVHTSYRKNGIGRRLMEMCLNHARTGNESVLALHTGNYMYAARNMYVDMGFQQVKSFTLFGKKYGVYTINLKH